jgi:hypothetical protein
MTKFREYFDRFRKQVDRMAVSIFYICNTLLVISMFVNLFLNFNIKEGYLTTLLYGISFSVFYLVVRSIKIKIKEEEEDGS